MLLIGIQVILLLVQLASLALYVSWTLTSSPHNPAPEWIPTARLISIWLVVPAVAFTLLLANRRERDI
jgi:hypothetical protein